ncbi:MAG TPA: hypothetical protein VM219_07800 [Phycisphaerae bacterium]|nr:hypothetical protein [Phycisphaerae bacterium]
MSTIKPATLALLAFGGTMATPLPLQKIRQPPCGATAEAPGTPETLVARVKEGPPTPKPSSTSPAF